MKTNFLIALIFISISTFAQKPGKINNRTNFTPEQQAELQTKRLSLALDLNEKQIAEVQALELEIAKDREANRTLRQSKRNTGVRPTDEEIFEMKSARLDTQTAHKNKMKSILTKEQYTKWEDMCLNNPQNRNAQRPNKMNKQNCSNGGNRPARGNGGNGWK